MEYLLIGVGGTGARVLESFAYMSAAGIFGKEIPKVHMRMVDMDANNGNLCRLKKVLDNYDSVYEPLFENVPNWHSRKILYKSPSLPFTWEIGVDNHSTLEEKFMQNFEDSTFLHGLYETKDLVMELEQGCKGRPRIGALEITKRFLDDINLRENSFWENLFSGDIQQAKQNGDLRIMIVGSMFGGSGASGVPTLAKLIKDKYCAYDENLIGITIMAPFYNFQDTLVENNNGAKSKNFMINSKAALKYYAESNIFEKIHSFRLVGGEARPMKKLSDDNFALSGNTENANTSTGSEQQCNPAMPELLTASLAILDFFRNASANNSKQVVIADTGYDGRSNWQAYPCGQELKNGLDRLQRLALLWRLIETSTYIPDVWRILYKQYKEHKLLSFTKDNVFTVENFNSKTPLIRLFFRGEPGDAVSRNVGVLGYLRELEKNGMGSAVNTETEIKYIDDAKNLDNMDYTEKICREVSIANLVDKLRLPRDFKDEWDKGENRLRRFIARTVDASL